MLISVNTGLYSARKEQPRIPMAQAMAFFGQAGFEAVDVNFSAAIYEDEFRHEPILDGDWERSLDEVMKAAEENGLAIALTHLPFYRYDLPDRERLDRYTAMMYRAIEATAYIGAKYAVLHPHRNESLETLVPESVSFLTPFRDAAQSLQVTLCVENMRTTGAETLARITDALNVSACWDVGHANLGGFDQFASISTLGGRLKALHLHDNYGTKDDHSLPFLGTVNWQAILSALKAIGYEGVFNYEVSASALPMELREEHAAYLVKAAKYLLGRK